MNELSIKKQKELQDEFYEKEKSLSKQLEDSKHSQEQQKSKDSE